MYQHPHFLHFNGGLHSDRYISFAENQKVKQNFQFSFYFFVFNIFWLLHKKLFGLVPLWLLTNYLAFQFYYFCIGDSNPVDSANFFYLLILMVPHSLFSCYIYKLQYLYNSNLIWKHRNNIEYLLLRLRPYNLLGFTAFTIIVFIAILQTFVNITLKHNGMANSDNKTRDFLEYIDTMSPERQEQINRDFEKYQKMMNESQKNKDENIEPQK